MAIGLTAIGLTTIGLTAIVLTAIGLTAIGLLSKQSESRNSNMAAYEPEISEVAYLIFQTRYRNEVQLRVKRKLKYTCFRYVGCNI